MRAAVAQPCSIGCLDLILPRNRVPPVAQVNASGLPPHLTTALLYLSDVDRARGGYAGVRATVPLYWDMDDRARAWADRFASAHGGLRPTAAQAADYSATKQWLEAVRAAGTTDADAVVKVLDGHTFDDLFAHHATCGRATTW